MSALSTTAASADAGYVKSKVQGAAAQDANNLLLSAGFIGVTRVATAVDTILITDGIVIYQTAGGAFAATLPLAADAVGRIITFIKTDSAANAVTLTGAGAELINGANTNATLVAAQWDTARLYSDGTEWFAV